MVIDSHAHVGLEKEGIEERPGNKEFWEDTQTMSSYELGWELRGSPWMAEIRERLGEKRARVVPNLKIEHLIKSMDEAGISHCILCGMDVTMRRSRTGRWKEEPARWIVPNEYIAKLCNEYPDRFLGVIGVDPFKQEEAVKAVEHGFKDLHLTAGVKIFTPAGIAPNDKELCYPIYEKCLEFGLPAVVHTGPESVTGARLCHNGVPVIDPLLVDEVAMDFPDLRIHMLHCGWFSHVPQAMAVVYKNPNVYTDCSLINPKWMKLKGYRDVDFFKWFETLWPDKIMYASDYPFNPHREAIEIINSYPLSEEFKKKLFEENAKRFYGIK